MDFLNFIIGLFLVIGCVIYFIYEVNRYNKEKKIDYMIFSYDIKIYMGVLTFLAIGIIMLYRELKTFL